MKIGIDCRMYGPQQTGIGTYIYYLIKYLINLDEKNKYVLFFLKNKAHLNFKNKKSKLYLEIKGSKLKIKSVNAPWYSFKEQIFLPLSLYQENLDLMHFTHFNAPILYQKRFIVTIHDLTPMFWPGHKMGGSFLRKFAYRQVLKNVIYRSSAIIAPSEFTKNDILKNFNVNPRKIHVIYEGIKNKLPKAQREYFLNNIERKINQAKSQLKQKYSLDFDFPYILYVGVWRNHKNLTGLIKAFYKLKVEKEIPHKLVICGKEDPYYQEVKKTISDLKLEKEVVLAGLVTGKKLDLIYQGAQAYVLPSFYEGFGLTPLEALNQATPAAVSEVGPMPEILGDSVLYFNPANIEDMASKIFSLINDKDLQKKLLLKSQNVLKRYSWKKMVQKTLEIYNKVMS